MLVSEERGKPESGEKPVGAERITKNKHNPHMKPGPGIEPVIYWSDASALTSAPSLLLRKSCLHIDAN